MTRDPRSRLVTTAVVGVHAFSIGAATFAVAGIVGGVITACENVTTGLLRVETPTAPCNLTASSPVQLEQRITWNQVGQQGPTGATGATGARGLTWRGPYSPLTSYAIDDAVQHLGSSWVAIAPVTGGCGPAPIGNVCINAAAPPNPLFWNLLAKKGEDGAIGPSGPVGLNWRGSYVGSSSYAPNDAVGADGSSWIATAAIPPSGCVNPKVPSTCVFNNPGANPSWQLLASIGDAGATGAQGAAGSQGPTGATGPQGPAGAAGSSGPLYTKIFGGPNIELGSVNGTVGVQTEVAALNLPAGAYQVTATVSLINDASFVAQDNSRQVQCWLGGFPLGVNSVSSITIVPGVFGWGSLTVQGSFSSASAALHVPLMCDASSIDPDHSHVFAISALIQAMPVGSISFQ